MVNTDEIKLFLKEALNHVEDVDIELKRIELAGSIKNSEYGPLVKSLRAQRKRLLKEVTKWEKFLELAEKQNVAK